MTYDERQVAEAREHLLPEIEKTRRTGSSDYWRVRQDIEGKDMPYNATISKPLADVLKALDAARLAALRTKGPVRYYITADAVCRKGMEREGGHQVSDLRYPETPQRRSQAPEGRDRRLTHHHH